MNVEDVFFTVARDIKQRLAAETDSKPEVQFDRAVLSEVCLGVFCLSLELNKVIRLGGFGLSFAQMPGLDGWNADECCLFMWISQQSSKSAPGVNLSASAGQPKPAGSSCCS